MDDLLIRSERRFKVESSLDGLKRREEEEEES